MVRRSLNVCHRGCGEERDPVVGKIVAGNLKVDNRLRCKRIALRGAANPDDKRGARCLDARAMG